MRLTSTVLFRFSLSDTPTLRESGCEEEMFGFLAQAHGAESPPLWRDRNFFAALSEGLQKTESAEITELRAALALERFHIKDRALWKLYARSASGCSWR